MEYNNNISIDYNEDLIESEDSIISNLDSNNMEIENINIADLPNIPMNEWLALSDFYNSTTGSQWRLRVKSTQWNFTNYNYNNPCRSKWYYYNYYYKY